MSSSSTGTCPNCSNPFTQYNPPHKLINCTHMMCKRCLLSQKSCSVCQAEINLDEHFLKDFSIVSLQQVRLPAHSKVGGCGKGEEKKGMCVKAEERMHRRSEHVADVTLEEFYIQECLLHNKPADLICIDDRTVICANCALFGKHKGHQVINREGVLNKFATYVQDCLAIYDDLKNQAKQFTVQNYKNDYQKLLMQKKVYDQRRLSVKFQSLINSIRLIQQNQLFKISQYYRQKQKAYQQKQQNIQKIQLDVKNWFTKIQSIGSLMSNIKNLDDLSQCIPYIDDKNSNKYQILDQGQQLIHKLNQSKGLLKNQLKVEQSNDYLIFDEQKIKSVSSYFTLKNFQTTKHKKTQSMKKVLQQNNKSPFINKNAKPFSSSAKNRLKTETPISSCKLSNQKTRIRKQIQVNLFPDDNLLLSVEQPNKFIKFQQSQLPVIERVYIAQQLDVENIPQLSISDIRPATCLSSEQSSDQSRFLQRDRQLKQIANEAPNQRPTNLIDQKKKRKSQFPEKFKGIVDDLKNDRAQTIDLTGADAGDSSILSICPFIKKSRKLKTLKLIKNKLTDDCLGQLMQALSESKVVNLNLSQNLLTDKACSIISSIQLLPNLKSITLSLNKINRRNVKPKTDQLAKRNLTILL